MNEHILGTPKPQARPRAACRNGKAFMYNPDSKAQKEWKLAIDATLSRHANKQLDGAFEVVLEFYMPRPKSHYKSGRFSHILKDDAPLEHTSRGDVDNLCKVVLDRITKCGYWKDDSNVIYLTISKHYDDLFEAGVRVITKVL